MKKLLSVFLAVIIIFSTLTVSVFASDDEIVISETTEQFEDGSYLIVTLTEEKSSNLRATSTKTGSKTFTLYNSNDEKLLVMKLTATFSYTGSSATCTNVAPTFTVYNSNWRVTKSTGTKSGNKGIGDFTAKQYVLNVPINTKDVTITITCSNTGVLS